jgi:hypothetical protein
MIALCALAAACVRETPLESATSTIVVHAVLNAANDDQIVAVQQTTHGAAMGAYVDSAVVTITGPDGVAMIGVEVPDSSLGRVYRVRLSVYGEALVPGGTYRLHVHLKSGADVTGATTIPSAQPSTAAPPMQNFDDATDTLRLSWPAVGGAASYEVRVQSTAGVYAQFGDTSAVLPGTLRSLDGKIVFQVPLVHTVVVSAVDEAYYEYYRTNSDPFTGTAVQGNLTGAEGVFGSLVVLAVRGVRVTAGP